MSSSLQVGQDKTPRSAPASTSDERRRALDGGLRQLERVDLRSTMAYMDSDIDARSFGAWIKHARSLTDPDAMRNSLYYGFQPLFDAIVDERLPELQRPHAIRALNSIVSTSTAFLTSYYSGRVDIEVFRQGISRVEADITRLDGKAPYKKKGRNVDWNDIYPANIQSFVRQFLEYAIEGKIPIPDFVIGCACGSSEMAIVLAGIIGTKIGFLRKSNRRGDENVLAVREQVLAIRQSSMGADVACIEDYVCTSISLSDVMRVTQGFGPSSIIGASVKFSHEGTHVRNFVSREDFNLFKIGRRE